MLEISLVWFGLLAVATIAISRFGVGWLIGWLTRRDMVDKPGERRLHSGSVPRGGGIVIADLVIATLLFLTVLEADYRLFLLAVLLCFWTALGWFDDRHDASAKSRFLIQMILVAIFMAVFGYIDTLVLSENTILYLGYWGAVFSFLGFLWFVNLYNFMDGMDGLAASQAIIAALTLVFWFWSAGASSMALICLIAAAASYGFLILNWSPAKVFLGDAGSIFLGAFFAMLIILGTIQYDIPVLAFIVLFSVFVFDASFTLLLRASRREKVWQAHRSHLYQRLAALNYPHDRIVIGLIVVMLLSSLLATLSVQNHAILPYSLSIVVAIHAILAMIIKRLETGNDNP